METFAHSLTLWVIKFDPEAAKKWLSPDCRTP